jgi:hypothetical protein
MLHNGLYPRELNNRERELLLWLLPADRPGYEEYRWLVTSWKVAGQGRRGEGNFILAAPGERIDNESPLPQVLAYGVVKTTTNEDSVAIRERLGNQLEYEIVNLHPAASGEDGEELSRWTYSTWLPSLPCPICRQSIREVAMKTRNGSLLILAMCPRDRRLWVNNQSSGVNHPIPVTNIYNELMIHKNIRDPKRALDYNRLFSEISSFSDADLSKAFASYNDIRTKIPLRDRIVLEEPRKVSFISRMFSRS